MTSAVMEPKPAERPGPPDAPIAQPEGPKLAPHEIMKAIEADPIIRRANELFGARLDHGEEER